MCVCGRSCASLHVQCIRMRVFVKTCMCSTMAIGNVYENKQTDIDQTNFNYDDDDYDEDNNSTDY